MVWMPSRGGEGASHGVHGVRMGTVVGSLGRPHGIARFVVRGAGSRSCFAGVWGLGPGRDGLAFTRGNSLGSNAYRSVGLPGSQGQGQLSRGEAFPRPFAQPFAVQRGAGAGSRSCFAWRVGVGAGPGRSSIHEGKLAIHEGKLAFTRGNSFRMHIGQ
jgi:hypothetical protein